MEYVCCSSSKTIENSFTWSQGKNIIAIWKCKRFVTISVEQRLCLKVMKVTILWWEQLWKILPWLKWVLMESLSQEGRSRSWSGWTRFSSVIWTCRWGLHFPISERQENIEQAASPRTEVIHPHQTPSIVSTMTSLVTLMVSSVMASCLYCVPYHSSVLSVCPSKDFDTTATLENKKIKETMSHFMIQLHLLQSLLDTVCMPQLHNMRWKWFAISILFESCLRKWRSTDTFASNRRAMFRIPICTTGALSVLHLEFVLHWYLKHSNSR